MGTSLLLHALSLKDRMLEPNRLPLSGQVWVYEKESCSREMFVGNCISMLSSLGIEDVEISWNNDIMAFDSHYKDQKITIIISLKDDSLASDYFYFLGIWFCPRAGKLTGTDLFSGLSPWVEEDLLKPDATFSVRVSDTPLQLPDFIELLGKDVFGQALYQNHYYIAGKTIAGEIQKGDFVICPTSFGQNHARYEIRHMLYSLRNLMAMKSRVMKVYEKMFEDDVGLRLYQELLVLMTRADEKTVPNQEWDRLVCDNGKISLNAASQMVNFRNKDNELQGISKLFQAILKELDITEMRGVPSLAERMLVPFGHARDLLNDRVEMLKRSENQA